MIERRTLKDGRKVYRVRWRPGGRGSTYHSRAFDKREDALRFETEIRRRKQLGDLVYLENTKETLDEFAREWWRRYASRELAPLTQRRYAQLWDLHVLPRLGTHQLRQLTPNVIALFQEDLRAAGVGEPTIRKTLAVLQSVCREAVTWGRITTNPVKPVKKRAQHRKRSVKPLAPEMIERLRWQVPKERDAALISLLAYAGLRPGEALGLVWSDVGERTVLVERSVSLNEIRETKTRSMRTVRLVPALKADLEALRSRQTDVADDDPVIPAHDGTHWKEDDWRNWRRRVFLPAAQAVGLRGARPYDLRHSFVSLLIVEGRSIVEIARQAGHSPTMTLNTYGHVFDELDGDTRRPAEDVIREARSTVLHEVRAPSVHPQNTLDASEEDKSLRFAEIF